MRPRRARVAEPDAGRCPCPADSAVGGSAVLPDRAGQVPSASPWSAAAGSAVGFSTVCAQAA
eukprot:2773777-Lingulodinium_polyedra.AAC.1